ncbi:MAG: sugar phosphate isomerase/epimerase family protein [bacterium]
MKILSVSTIIFNNGELDWSSIKNAGFDFVEARCDDIIPDDDPSVLEDIGKTLKKNSLTLSSIHSFYRGVDISSEDRWLKTKSIREIEKSIATAHCLSCGNVVIHLSDRIKNQESKEKLLSNALESVKEASILAQRFSVKLLLENLPTGMLLSDTDELERVVGMGFNLCFDLGHALLTGIDPVEFCRRHKSNIREIHVHFNNGSSDSHSFFTGIREQRLLSEVSSVLPDDMIYTLEMKPERSLTEMNKVLKMALNTKPEEGSKDDTH